MPQPGTHADVRPVNSRSTLERAEKDYSPSTASLDSASCAAPTRWSGSTKRSAAFTGDRYRSGAEKRLRIGYEWVHSLVDDHSRLAYSELHRDERAATVTGFLERGLAFYATHGIEPKRLLSDNALCLPAQPLPAPAARHQRHPPPAHSDPPSAGQRQGRAIPANAETRVGARPHLPLQRPPRASTVTLGQPLQQAQTAQLARWPVTDQPCPQRPEAGHLDLRLVVRRYTGQ